MPGPRSQDPAGEGADPARVRAALHHGRRAARVPQQVPAGAGLARPGGPALTPVVAEVPEGEASAGDAGSVLWLGRLSRRKTAGGACSCSPDVVSVLGRSRVYAFCHRKVTRFQISSKLTL